ncbi:MarR family protein [Arthrobacter saudimassiliensis]|uniref:MarR family protein n=1 Tax=Arthrobacter saudimassiliensis TaxID=1461584 RepID=A0A078MKF4_9MICC|nr:MarR family protein [Arthrobacter saudimassiliensis]
MTATRPLPMDPIAEARRQWEDHGWADAAPGMEAVTAVMRAQQIMLTRIEAALRPFGISFSRYELLTLLSFTRTGMLPMSKLSARLQVHPTSVTNTVDRLEAAGLVRRRPDPADGRSRLVAITDAGRDVAQRATADLNGVFADIGLPEEDLEVLAAILRRFRQQAGDFTES